MYKIKVSRFFDIDWWKYILSKSNSDIGHIRTVICRLRKHKCGVMWYNINGLEPDMHCKNCGENLG